MITTVKLLIGILLTVMLPSEDDYVSITEDNKLVKMTMATEISIDKAFQVLDQKCNVCHEKRNKKRVFTTKNMTSSANDIYKQVFVKRRMPKGNNIKLSSEEYQDLLTWISSTKN